jgi:hypothetical protein
MRVEEWEKEDREFREIRRRNADWEFIKAQPPHIRAALLYFIEKGDIYRAARIAGMTVGEFNEHRYRARIPNITWSPAGESSKYEIWKFCANRD